METAETEHTQGVSVVETQLKSLIPRIRVWSGQDLGKGVRGKDSGRLGRKAKWGGSRLLLWLFYGKQEGGE